MASNLPYANATSGDAARGEIMRILRHFGCESIGFMDMVKDNSVLLQFEHGGRTVKLSASAKGWAAMYLKENPWNSRRRHSPDQWKEKALEQGLIAVNSILRDWVKGQVTAIQCGIMSFNEVFMPHMLSNDGRRLVEVFEQYLALPAPDQSS
jgi:hypothetical protein